MNTSEDTAKVAVRFIDALKQEPLSLALVLMNICLLGFFYMWFHVWTLQQEKELDLLYGDKKEVRELLSKCVVPNSLQ